MNTKASSAFCKPGAQKESLLSEEESSETRMTKTLLSPKQHKQDQTNQGTKPTQRTSHAHLVFPSDMQNEAHHFLLRHVSHFPFK